MVKPHAVHETLSSHQLADGMGLVLDLDRSKGVWIHDSRSDDVYWDAFTCFASWPIGYNHPGLHDEHFTNELVQAARHKPSNSDLYTSEMAMFVDAFGSRVTPPEYPFHFWVSGGALAVENALKTAFDWKARRLGRTSFHDDVNDLVILHFEKAFHGRSGYTMSLTNTVPDKVGLFPKFPWPRVPAPAIEFDLDGGIANDIEAAEAASCKAIEEVFAKYKGKVAGILIETMQGEGGDRHFRTEFLQKLRDYADAEDALLLFDEVQTGFYGSGHAWMWQGKGVAPDVVAFGKKTQVCGIYANERVDEVENNVFRASSRINSTWGGNLVDMIRCRKFIEIIESENLAARTVETGNHVVAQLRSMAKDTGGFTNVRGMGSLIAFSFADTAGRDHMLNALYDEKVLALPCGEKTVRFRLPLTTTIEEADELLNRTKKAVADVSAATA